MKRLVIVLAAVLALQVQGCTVLQSARYAVSRYCALPDAARTAITCAGDTP